MTQCLLGGLQVAFSVSAVLYVTIVSLIVSDTLEEGIYWKSK